MRTWGLMLSFIHKSAVAGSMFKVVGIVCSPNRTQGCRKTQQGYLFHTNAVFPHKTSQQAHARLVTTLGLPSLLYKHTASA